MQNDNLSSAEEAAAPKCILCFSEGGEYHAELKSGRHLYGLCERCADLWDGSVEEPQLMIVDGPAPVAAPIAPAAVSDAEIPEGMLKAAQDAAASLTAEQCFGEPTRAQIAAVAVGAAMRWNAKPSAEGDGWIAVTERLPNVAKADHCCISEDEAPTISEPVIVWNEDDCEQVIAELEIVDGLAAGAVWHSRETGNEIHGVTYWKPSAPPSGQGEVK